MGGTRYEGVANEHPTRTAARRPSRSREAERRQRRERWKREHQPFELESHRADNFRWHDASFWRQWDHVFGEFCGLAADSFGPDDTLLDLGCGSRPALDWFEDGPRKVHLDPLLTDYRHIPQVARFWRTKCIDDQIAAPAEDAVPELDGRCQFVLCWNVLDHTFDWQEILENVRRYVAPGGIACVGTDLETHGPARTGPEGARELTPFLARHFEVRARQVDRLGRDTAVVLQKPPLRV